MAGSRRDFLYTDDAANKYALNLDESNSKGKINPVGSTAVATDLFIAATSPFPGRPPSGFRPRGVNTFNKADPRETRFFKIGNPAAYSIAISGASEISAYRTSPTATGDVLVTWVVRSGRPERRGTVPNFSTDTGLDDGTPKGND
jgi:hypothetical protein